MNHVYRLVFNRALGVMQVASELAQAPHGGCTAGTGTVTATVPWLRFALWGVLGLFGFLAPAFAQDGRIIADANAPSAQRPTVLDAGNGVPMVNITTPSAQGVSRNTYSQFDVGAQGAILNNSRTNADTQLAGGIAGNPWLATGPAKVILNEIHGPASQLHGYVEVAGQKAAVVIANPAGIQVNGGGFLNASRVTLTTGTPVFNGGSLDRYRVEGGAITVDGAGLDTSRVDYTDLISRTLQLNAGVWANQLQATLGTNTVTADHSQVTTTEVSSAAPAYALDVGALGGMFANKIFLVGTEHGVGVRNAGDIGAQAGELAVTVDGRLENSGKLQAQTNTRLDVRGGVANGGTISAGRELVVYTPADLDNRGGTLNAQRIEVSAGALANRDGTIEQTGPQALALNAGAVSNRDGGRIGIAELAPTGPGTSPGTRGESPGGEGGADGTDTGAGGGDGKVVPLPLPEPLADCALNIAGRLDNDGGVINAGGGVALSTANGLDNSGGRLGLRELTLTQGDLANAGGELNVAGNANLRVGQFNNDGGRFDLAGSLQVQAQTLSNRGGTLTQGGAGASSIRIADTFDNTHGTLATNAAALALDSAVLVNERGLIEHAGADGLTVRTDRLQGAEGRIATAGAANLSGGQVDHRRATLSATQVAIIARDFDNRRGHVLASGTSGNTLDVAGTLDNSDGILASQGTGALAIHATALNGAGGTIASNGVLTVTGTTTDLRGGTTAAQRLAIDTATLVTAGGTLTAAGTDALRLTARDRLDNSAGQIATNGALQLQTGHLATTGGTISAAGTDGSTLRVDDALDNRRGVIATTGALDVHAGNVDNTDGTLQVASEEGLTITADGRVANDGGAISSKGAIDLTAQTLSNADGTIQTAKAIITSVTDAFDNTHGTVVAGGDLTIDAGALINRDTFDPTNSDPMAQKGLFGQQVTVRADAIDNTGGQLHAAGVLALQGRTQSGTALRNAGGTIDGSDAVSVSATVFDNAAGKLVQRGAAGALMLSVDGLLENTAGGLLGAEGDATLQAGTLNNTGGTIFASGNLAAGSIGNLTNRDGGLIQSNGDLTVSAGGSFDNTDGSVDATGRAVLDAARIDNVRGQLLAGGVTDDTALTVSTSVLNNQGGTIGAREGNLALNIATLDNSAGGRLVAQRDIDFNATTGVNNAGGTVFAARNLAYENAGGSLSNAGGQFGAGDTARITLATVSNTDGGRIQADSVWMTTPNLDLHGGEIVANALNANLAALTGTGRLYGAAELHVNFDGDFTYESGQRFESDALLDLAVAGAFTNRGNLQTAGELQLNADSLTNYGTINASNSEGLGEANVHVAGTIDNQRGASLEGDTLNLTSTKITNTGDIVGDQVRIDAETLINGRDLHQLPAFVDYGEGFIGAAASLDIRLGHSMGNLDGDIYSAGDLTIAGRTDGSRVGLVDNVSGRIQAEGDLTIAAEQLANERRVIATESYTLTPEEQYALSSQRQFDEAMAALTDAERQRLAYLNSRGAANLSAAEILEKKALNHRVGWQTVDHVSDDMLAAINHWYKTVGAPGHGASDGYVIDDAATAADNPGAEVIQRDTYTTGERLIGGQTSAAGQIVSGGDMTLDVGTRVRNHTSQIAAGGNLTIAGQNYTGTSESSDARIENIAVAGQLTGERETQAWVYPEIPAMYKNGSGWHQTVAELQGFMRENITAQGPTLLTASITAGQGLSIQAGDVTNTAVSNRGGLSDLNGGSLSGPGSTGVGNAGGIAGANGPDGPAGVGSQVVGTPERPLPGLVPSDNGMFDVHAEPNSPFLVTTAPRFAKGDGTGSNYLLNRLGVTTDLHKRLGDGYYEQRLIMEQILSLTGRRSLTGNGDGFEQYRVLMDHAADEAARLGFRLGAPLTSAQIGALNQDIVWLVEQEVNGQTVLVPVVYLSKATAEKMKAAGALMSADTVDVQSSGTVRNDGTLDSTRGTWLSADTLINDGAIRSQGRVDIATVGNTVNRGKLVGNTVAIDAGGDVINTVRFDGVNATDGQIQAGPGGVQMSAANDVVNQGTVKSDGHTMVSAGRDFVQNAATGSGVAGSVKAPAGAMTSTGSTVVTAGQDVVLDQSAVTVGQHAVIDASRDAKFVASEVNADGSIAVTAGRDIVSETVSDSITVIEQTRKREGKKKTNTTTTTTDEIVTGSTFQAGGDIAMVAERDIHLTAASVNSDEGAVALSAKRDVILDVEHETHTFEQNSVSKKKGTLSSTKTTTHDKVTDELALGTTVTGQSVAIAAGRDVTVTGAQIVGTDDVTVVAARHLNVDAAESTRTEERSSTTKKSGVMGTGGVGIMAGSRTVGQTLTATQSVAEGSLIASSSGKVALVAGETAHIRGSDVVSAAGTTVVGKTVTIESAEQAHTRTDGRHFKQSGIELSLSGQAVNAATSAYYGAKTARETDNDRLKLASAMAAGFATWDAYQAAKGINTTEPSKNFNADQPGTPQNDPVNLKLGISSQSASGQTTVEGVTQRGSTIRSNRNVAIVATEGDLTITGSKVSGDQVALDAARKLILQSSQDTRSQHSTSKSGGGGVGILVGQSGFGFYVEGNASRGRADGDTVQHNETIVSGNRVTFRSGGDTTLDGAQILGDQVIGKVGGNLNVISQQDTDTYLTREKAASGQVVIGAGVSGNASYTQNRIDSEYRSVQEQSGIQAGAGGFQIDVRGSTTLDGGAIASTADASKNTFSTGGLTVRDIHNQAKYDTDSISISGGTGGVSPPKSGIEQADRSSSVTKASISAGTITIGDGNTEALATLDRGVSHLQSEGLKPIFDEQTVRENQAAGELMGYAASRTAGAIAGAMRDDAARDYVNATTPQEKAAAEARMDAWGEGGSNKVLLHGLTGALAATAGGGNALDGATGAVAGQLAHKTIHEYLEGQNILPGSDEYDRWMELGKALAGGAVGGGTGANTALSGEQYNRQLHSDEIDWVNANASEFALQENISLDEAKRRLLVEGAAQVDATINQRLNESRPITDQVDEAAMKFLTANKPEFAWGKGFEAADDAAYNNFNMFAKELAENPDAFRQVYNALGQSGLSQQGLQNLYHDQLRAYADDYRSDTGNVVRRFIGATGGVGAAAALGSIALGACGANPAACASAGQALAEIGIGDALGGTSLAVGAGTAAHVADSLITSSAGKADQIASAAGNLSRLNSQLIADEIANGHAFTKHVLEGGEFAALGVRTRSQFKDFIEGVVSNPNVEKRYAKDGTVYYLDHSTRTVVIRGSRGEATAFRPDFDFGWDNYISERVPRNTTPVGGGQ